MASRIQEGGSGMGSSGSFRAKAARVVAGITGKGAKQVAPAFKQMGTPPPPPGIKPLNPNPPKPPTSSSIPKKPPHVSETRNTAANPSSPKKSPPKKNPTKNRGPFLGSMAPGNWTGK